MATETIPRERPASRLPGGRTALMVAAPLLLLAAVIALFIATGGAGLDITPAAPVESLQFSRTVLKPDRIEIHIRNTSPKAITISQVNVNDAIWPFALSTGREIPRLGSATLTLDYPWVQAESYAITAFSGNSVAFNTAVGVATETPRATRQTLGSFTLIGIYVGIIPIILGMFWLAPLRRVGPKTMLFLMALTVGLLIFLGVDATGEAVEQAGLLPATFQGLGIVAIGLVGAFLLLDAIGRRQSVVGKSDASRRMRFASMISVGIGLHNLGEGLAIGAAYAIGAAALGTFLVVGFIVQNITEGLGIVVPIAKDKPSFRQLAILGLVAGAPAVAGAWIGGLVVSQPLSVLFLAIGAGAVFQVAFQIGRELVWRRDGKQSLPLTAFAGVTAGMLALYVTGVFIK